MTTLANAANGAIAILFAAAPALAQQWTQIGSTPTHVSGTSMVFAPRLGGFLACGGMPAGETTWVLHDSDWRVLSTTRSAPRRAGPSLAFDSARATIILFGGAEPSGRASDETWLFDGHAWRQATPSRTPGARVAHRLVFHSAAGHAVLYGGTGELPSTWTWDGTNWIPHAGSEPTRRTSPAMAYDPSRGRTILFGGNLVSGGRTDELWEWDGASWRRPGFTAPWPAARAAAGLTFDATVNRCLLFGGLGTSPPGLGDAWHWNGVAWTAAPAPPFSDTEPVLAGDANGRLVVFGHDDPRTWVRDPGGAWQRVSPDRPARSAVALAYDPAIRAPLRFGGSTFDREWTDVAVFVGNEWRTLSAGPGPTPRRGMGMSAHESRATLIGFGGHDGFAFTDETWEWNGGWTLRAPATRPPPRSHASLASDLWRGEVVMYGGLVSNGTSTNAVADTWIWNGLDWRRPVGFSPFPSRLAPMAFDPVRGTTVLHFGGEFGVPGATWSWNGISWTLQQHMNAPARSAVGVFVFDPWRSALQFLSDEALPGGGYAQWEWLGTAWARRNDVALPFAAANGIALWDVARARMFFHDGVATWATAGVTGEAEPFGSACVLGAASPPMLHFLGRPQLGQTDATWRVGALSPGAEFALLADLQRTAQPTSACLGWLPNPVVLAVGAAGASGAAELPMPIPLLPALAGLELFAQVAAAGPNGPAAGIGVSAGLRVRVGD